MSRAAVRRQLHLLPEVAKAKVQDLLQQGRILTQRTKDKNRIRALRAEVECISKNRAHTSSA